MEQIKKLPTFAELHRDIEEAKHYDQLNQLLNQPPRESWIKKHPIAAGVKYLPIDKVEYLLTRIFQKWRVEILDTKVMFQSICVTVRLTVTNPLTGEEMWHDGVGAKSVQTERGASAADLGAIKDAAVMLALPSAKSYAIKDAAEHFGALFGRDLNRKDTVGFMPGYDRVEDNTPKAIVATIDKDIDFIPDTPHYQEPSTQVNGKSKDTDDFIL